MAKTPSNSETSEVQQFSLISNEKLIAIYGVMLKSRLLEYRATELFQHGLLDSDLHASSGREAIAASATIDLQEGDSLALPGGDWLPCLNKKLPLEFIFRELAPASLRSAAAVEMEMSSKNILLSSSTIDLPQTVRERATANAVAKNGDIVEVFLDARSKSSVDWKKTIQACAVGKLPIVFIQYSDASNVSSEGKQESAPKAVAALYEGIPSISVDAHDAVAVYRVAYEAIVRARQLRGATLIQCVVQDPEATTRRDVTSAPTLDPVESMERYLKGKNIDPAKSCLQIIAGFQRELDLATRFLLRESNGSA